MSVCLSESDSEATPHPCHPSSAQALLKQWEEHVQESKEELPSKDKLVRTEQKGTGSQ